MVMRNWFSFQNGFNAIQEYAQFIDRVFLGVRALKRPKIFTIRTSEGTFEMVRSVLSLHGRVPEFAGYHMDEQRCRPSRNVLRIRLPVNRLVRAPVPVGGESDALLDVLGLDDVRPVPDQALVNDSAS